MLVKNRVLISGDQLAMSRSPETILGLNLQSLIHQFFAFSRSEYATGELDLSTLKIRLEKRTDDHLPAAYFEAEISAETS